MKASVVAAAAVFGLTAYLTTACTMIAVGKKATVDGSTIVTHNDDAGSVTADLRLVVVPAKAHHDSINRSVYRLQGGYPRVVAADRSPQYAAKAGENESTPLGFIPQIEKTYSYIAQEYAIVNQVQLSIGESTCNARTTGWPTSIPGGRAMFGLGELTSVAMERCDSARCAIRLMGSLAETYGFYSEYGGTPDAPGFDSEALGITDRYGEVWVFHILAGPNGNGGAIWAAQRVPDNHVAVVANHFTISAMNLTDSDWFLASSNVISTAIDHGWYTPKNNASHADFSFKAAYAKPPTVSPLLYTDGRTWRVYSTFARSQNVPATFGYMKDYPEYPFSVPVDELISLEAITTLLRDQYEDTEYDLTQGLAAGPFDSPLRYSGYTTGVHGGWMNPISVHRTLYSYAVQAKQPPHVTNTAKPAAMSDNEAPRHHPTTKVHIHEIDALLGMLWFGQSAPHGTVYLPFSCAQTSLPESFHDRAGYQGEFALGSAWWAFNLVNNWRTIRYNAISHDVNKFIATYQKEAFSLVQRRDSRDNDLRHGDLDALHNGFASRVVDARWKLAWKLISKYSDGYVTPDKEGPMKSLGYPAWWLNQTNYVQWVKPPVDVVVPLAAHLNRQHAAPESVAGGLIVPLLGGFVLGFVAHVLYQNHRRYEYRALA
ncbi:hypothetical protein H257_07396 [Aphanomyces astaci]|uniref:Peptidase n=1 Tax=Aphanomyces astaci TaxID=112090 RepID=W4GKC0_APHAT|nr:hypothetical protein H257_07396 [Aphanomyces astaci]ETV79368.1 hypothetical protein H257_07396 [Aphanomyces astaci]|eukprot:XP_009831209.1 hypothetical protein H257_07396 [Aphanomyces astaci]